MKHLYKALAAFQQECPIIHKGSTGYGYSYASIAEILQVINPLLQKHGLGFTQAVEGTCLRTCVFHCESGEDFAHEALIPQDVTLKGMNQFQVLGSAITYMRRYQLSAMLGIVTDKDTDAATPPQIAAAPKESFTPEHKGWGKAIEEISKGNVHPDQIKKKYILSKEHEKMLYDISAEIILKNSKLK